MSSSTTATPEGGAPPELLFVLSAISLYAGAALAVSLFDAVSPLGVGWMRVLGGGLFLLPFSRRPPPGTWPAVAGFGLVLACMNLCFYQAIALIPMGTTVAIEFLGPIAVALVASRSRQNLAAVALVTAGVFLLAGARKPDELLGVGWGLLAATFWGLYITAGHRLGRSLRTTDVVGPAMLMGALLTGVVGGPAAVPAFLDLRLLLLCAAVGALSNAVPYWLDQYVLARVEPDRFAILLGLLPACAALLAWVTLGQRLGGADWLGIVLVGAAVALKR